MSNSNVAVVSSATSTTISDSDAARILEAFKTLHHIISLQVSDDSPAPIAFEKLSGDDYVDVCQKALRAHKRFRSAKIEAQHRHFRAGCDAVVKTATEAAVKAKAEFDALSPTLKAMMPAFPSTVRIPVTAFASCFPTEWAATRHAPTLKDMGYVLDGRTKEPTVSVDLAPKVALAPPVKKDKAA